MYCTWLSGTVCLIVSPITVEYKGSRVQHGCNIKSKVYQLLFVTSERNSWLGFTWRSNRSTRRSYSLSLCCICCVNPLRVDVNRLCQIWGKQVNGGVIQNIWIYLRLTLLWYLWSQTLQNSCAIPSFLSILTVTELSWWQNRQVNVVSCDAKVSKQQHFWWGKLNIPRGSLRLGPVGFLEDFLRFPMSMEDKSQPRMRASSSKSCFTESGRFVVMNAWSRPPHARRYS